MSNLSNLPIHVPMSRYDINNILIYNYLYIFIIFYLIFINSILMLSQQHCNTTFDQFDMTDDRLADS